MSFEPVGTMVYTERQSTAQTAHQNGQLLVPRMDNLPILPDVGQVTDIVSTRDEVPWFDTAHPDPRPEVVERGCHH